MHFQSLVAYAALTLLTTVYASPIPAEQMNNRRTEFSREFEAASDIAGRSGWRRDGGEPAAIPMLKRAGADGRDLSSEENSGRPWQRAAEATPPSPGW